MGESHSLFRIAIFIGFVLLMGSVLATPWVYVGQPLPPNSAWGQFSSGIQNFPSFTNPFAQPANTLIAYDFLPIHPSRAAPSATSSVFVGCFGNESWACVQDLNGTDGEGSYVRLPNPVVNTSNAVWMDVSPNVRGRTISVQYDLWCRYTGPVSAGAYLIPTLWKWNGTANALIEGNVFQVSACGNGFFSHVYAVSDTCDRGTGGCGEVDSSLYDSPFSLQVASQAPFSTDPWTIDISTARVSITIGVVNADTTVTCGGDVITQLGCKIGQVGNFLFKFGQFIFNGVVFVFQVIAWFVGMVGIFFGSLASILSIPGAPPLVTGFIGILVIGCLFFVSIVIMGKIRGTGNTG